MIIKWLTVNWADGGGGEKKKGNGSGPTFSHQNNDSESEIK